MLVTDYKNCEIKVHRQLHKQYPPWVAIIYSRGNTVRMWNTEGSTMEETLEKAKKLIDKQLGNGV